MDANVATSRQLLATVLPEVAMYTDDSVVQRGIIEQSVAFIQKPFTPTVLLQKIRALLGANTPRGPA